MMECVLCALLSCLPGYYPSGCAAGSTRDAVCLPCLTNGGEGIIGAPGSFAWTGGCDYACSAGHRRVNGTRCVPCGAPSCGPGFWASECTEAADSVCLPCPALVGGPLNWTTGCNFQCAAGTYLDSGAAICRPCSSPVCLAGLRPVACTRTADASCVPCDPPVGDPAGSVWRDDVGEVGGGGAALPCEVRCVLGYYVAGTVGGTNCTRCTSRACAVGTYAAGCQGSSDSRCEACARPQGVFAWTGVLPCQFSCVLGWSWWNGTACVDCAAPVCPPGTYATQCTLSAPAACVPCAGGAGGGGGGVVYTSGCSFVCAAGYYFVGGGGATGAAGECRKCSSPVCAAGSFLVPCGVGSDARCAPCDVTIAGRIRWIGAGCTNFTCAYGTYRDWEGNRCVECSSPWCAPGFRPGACSATSDAECVPCDSPPSVRNGTFVWVNDGSVAGCAFECAAGYFLHPVLGSCERCSTDGCDNGFYRAGCRPLADAVCEPCLDEGDPGGAVWTHRCAFVCNTGYYMNPRTAWCSRCSRPACTAVGFTVSRCTATEDSRCVPCELPTPTGNAGVVWVGSSVPCSFICVAGYYLNLTGGMPRGCLPCSTPTCARGTRPTPCSLTSNSACVACTPPTGLYDWVDDGAGGLTVPPSSQPQHCAFVCRHGSHYRAGASSCMPCSTPSALACEPGTYYHPCSATEDAFCAPCATLGEGARWKATGECAFECADGFYLPSTSVATAYGGGGPAAACSRCLSDAACALGFHAVGCSSTADAVCVRCDTTPGANGTFVWSAPGCSGFSCVYGEPVYDDGGGIVGCPPAPPEVMAFVVVDTALSMNNTADVVCRELDALLLALSDALARVSECGCVQFATVATSLDGESCHESVCPQCGNATASANRSSPASRRRHLLSGGGGVDLKTVSTSLSPVPLAVVAEQAPPAAPLLRTELAASLASVAPALVPAGVAAAVSNVVTQPSPPPSSRRPAPSPPVLLSLAVIMCLIAFIVLLAVCVCAVCPRGCIPLRRPRWAARTEGTARISDDTGPVNNGIGADFSGVRLQEWMPSIRPSMRRRAGDDGV